MLPPWHTAEGLTSPAAHHYQQESRHEGRHEQKNPFVLDPEGGEKMDKAAGKDHHNHNLGTTKTSKALPSSLLLNAERAELHNEIYVYFKWLELRIFGTGPAPDNAPSGRSQSRRASSLGMSATAIRRVLSILSSEIRSVRDDTVVLDALAGDLARSGDRVPFLERHCEGELRRRLDETRQEGPVLKGGVHKSWDERFEDLARNTHIMHSCTYEDMNARYDGIGEWLSKQRSLYAKKDETFMESR